MHSRLLFHALSGLVAAGFGAGCFRSDAAPTTTPLVDEAPAIATATAAPRHGMEAPFVAEIVEQDASPNRAVLAVRTRHVTPLPIDVQVTIELPHGVRIAKGPSSWTIPPSAQSGIFERELLITFERVPAEDLVVVADAQAENFGVHARASYRFGRSEPRLVPPQANGPELKVGGRNFGRSVGTDQ